MFDLPSDRLHYNEGDVVFCLDIEPVGGASSEGDQFHVFVEPSALGIDAYPRRLIAGDRSAGHLDGQVDRLCLFFRVEIVLQAGEWATRNVLTFRK